MVFFLRWNVGTTQVWCTEARQPTKSWTGWQHWQESAFIQTSLQDELRFQIIQAVKTQFHECTIKEFWSCSNLSLQQKEFIQSIYCTLYMLVYSHIQYTFQYLTYHIFHSCQKYFERKSKQQQMQLHAIDVKLRKKCVFWDFVDP